MSQFAQMQDARCKMQMLDTYSTNMYHFIFSSCDRLKLPFQVEIQIIFVTGQKPPNIKEGE